MLWYAIQSYTGKEEQLTEMIRRVVPERYYGECFVPYFERLRCWRQQNQVHILRLFPGYLFISTDSIEAVFQCLKRVPAMSKILTAGAFEFTPLYDSEAEFLKEILDADHIVRLTYTATDGKGHVTYMTGPLEKCRDRIETYKFRDRYAQVRLTIAGQEKTVRMGIILNDDVRREMAYGKVEAHITTPEKYALGNTSTESLALCPHGNGKPAAMLRPGDCVAVISGAYTTKYGRIRGEIMTRQHLQTMKKMLYPICCSLYLKKLYEHDLRKNMYAVQNGISLESYRFDKKRRESFRENRFWIIICRNRYICAELQRIYQQNYNRLSCLL